MPRFSGAFLIDLLRCLVSDSSKMISRYILPPECPYDCPVDPRPSPPRLLSGETTQGFSTASYVQKKTHSEVFDEVTLSQFSLKRLLWVAPIYICYGLILIFFTE